MTTPKPLAFEPAAFADPPAFFGPSCFWIWNDRLRPDELRRQLRDMREHGVRGVCIVPEPPEFRPEIMPTALEPEYLSPAYFEMVRVVVEECAALDMLFWLYDEGGWPSGSACGRVVAARPDLASCRLEARTLPLSEEERSTVVATAWEGPDGHTCCRIGFCPEASGGPVSVYRVARPQERGRGQPLTPDLLSPDTSRTFLELTHDRYAAAVGPRMGAGLPVDRAFTDEPAVPSVVVGRQVPWTDGFLELFRAEEGYDLLPHLPVLFREPRTLGREEMRVRLDFFDVWSRRFVTAFLEPIRSWCHRHGMLSAGHFGGEDETEGSVTYGFGHILRSLRALDMPGVDVIWRQLFPGRRAHSFPKYASSVARQTDGLAISESFAVYGSGLTPAEMKWLVDFQWVRGVTSLVGSAYPYSTRDHFMLGERPHLSPVSPLWDGLADLHSYVARLSYALSAGQPRVQAAVYFPIRDIWTGLAGGSGVAEAHEAVAQALLGAQCDFDYVDDDVLQTASSEGGALAVGSMRYDTLVLPPAQWIPEATVGALARFVKSGGRLLVCGAGHRCDGERPVLSLLGVGELGPGSAVRLGAGTVKVVSPEAVAASLPPLIRAEPEATALRVCSRRSSSGSLYFLVNEGAAELATTVRFPERDRPTALDPVGGDGTPCRAAVASGGGVDLPLRLARFESLLLWFPAGGAPQASPERWTVTAERALSSLPGWRIRPLRAHRMGDHDYELEDLSQEPDRPVGLGDWGAALGEGFSGKAEYSLEFDWGGETSDEAWIELGDVRFVAEAWLNGTYLGRRAWPPYRVPARGCLRAGRNRLRLVVANTLANALLGPRGEASLRSHPEPGWAGPYDAKARLFERDSLASGLLGPVRVLCGLWTRSGGDGAV